MRPGRMSKRLSGAKLLLLGRLKGHLSRQKAVQKRSNKDWSREGRRQLERTK